MPTPPESRPIGSHVRVGGRLPNSLVAADAINAETIQIFAGNPRGWAPSAGDPAADAAFREACERRGMRVFVHAPYLINLGSPNPDVRAKSAASVAHNLLRAHQIGAEGVVVHTGSTTLAEPNGTAAEGLARVREGLLPILDALDADAPLLLLEPTAGQGRSLCAGVEDLVDYLAALDRHDRLGICLDTCHAFAAGEPLDQPDGVADTLSRLEEVAGVGALKLIHANDSKDPRGSFKDRHERIGEGHIGEDAFRELLAHPATAGVPFIAETPGSGEPGGTCLPLLKKLRDE